MTDELSPGTVEMASSVKGAKPPAAALRDGIEEVQLLLKALIGQNLDQMSGLKEVLTTLQDTLKNATDVMHHQGEDILLRITEFGAPKAPQVVKVGWPWWVTVAASGSVLLVALVGAWFLRPDTRYHRLGLQVDTVLVQYHGSLPKPVQEQLSVVYAREQIQGPGSRTRGGAR